MKREGTGHLRRAAWILGVAACVGYYAAQATRLPRRTSVGRETALFPQSELELGFLESPSGANWMVTAYGGYGPPLPFGGTPPDPPGWPPATLSPRRITFLHPTGTWRLDGGALRRAWRFNALRRPDERHLRGAFTGASGDTTRVVLDLKTGRTAIGPGDYEDYSDYYHEDELYAEGSDLLPVLNSPLEHLPQGLHFEEQERYVVGGRALYLLFATEAEGQRQPLYAASDDAAPRLLRLTDEGAPLALSRDGRTLFFARRNMLWRLDLRKPLPELLDEVPLPTLPEPRLD